MVILYLFMTLWTAGLVFAMADTWMQALAAAPIASGGALLGVAVLVCGRDGERT